MRWALLVVCLVLYLAALALGLRLGKRSQRAATAAIALGLLGLLARTVFRYHPTWEYALAPWSWYPIVRAWWGQPFALLILGAGSHHMSSDRAGRALWVLAAGVLLHSGAQLWITARFDPQDVTGEVNPRGICVQTTGYTCGAAAASTLLALHGVEVTERELAVRCWTNAMTGTDELSVVRGVRQVIPDGWEVELGKTDLDGLRAHCPAMVTIKYQFMVDHWVVVREVKENGTVVVGDPLVGSWLTYAEGEFLDKWRRGYVEVRK